jgi:radical SAM protein with 4Fe4S-binding SPASM domain
MFSSIAPRRDSGPQIRAIAFEVIEKCNLFCSFCVRSADRKLRGAVPPDRFARRIKTVVEEFPELYHIAITGGEPFLHPKLLQLVSIAHQTGKRVSITTNGTIRGEQALRIFKTLKRIHLIISIDGSTADIHDTVRGQQGAFDRTVDFAHQCHRVGLPFLVNMTVGPSNYEHVYSLIELANSLGALDVSVSLIKPHGRGSELRNGSEILVETARQVMMAKRDFGSLAIHFTEPLAHIFDPLLAGSGMRKGCGAGSGTLHVQCDGTVLICTACAASYGNLDAFESGFAAQVHLNSNRRHINRREGLGGECGNCEYTDVCGGCRCRAQVTSSLLGEDPLCPKNSATVSPHDLHKFFYAVGERLGCRGSLEPWSIDAEINDPTSLLTTERALRRWLEIGVLPMELSGRRIALIGPRMDRSALMLAAGGATVNVFGGDSTTYEELKAFAISTDLSVATHLGSFAEQPIGVAYDFVYFRNALHIGNVAPALASAHRHLYPNGTLLIDLLPDGSSHPVPSRLSILDGLRSAGFGRPRVADFDRSLRFQVSATPL